MSDDSDSYQMGTPASVASDKMEKPSLDVKTKISYLLKDKEQEWTAVAERKGPLRLLDLPMDVLKEIVKEVRLQPYERSCIRTRPFPTTTCSLLLCSRRCITGSHC